MWEYNYSDELYHYGRKGMKWGQHIFGKIQARKAAKQRKENLEKARKARAAKKQAAEERKKKVESGKIPAKKMTNEELQERINRLELEKKYNDAMKSSKEFTKGSRFMDKFTNSTIDKIAENSTADIVAQAVKVMTAKAVNTGFGSEVVFTNNKRNK